MKFVPDTGASLNIIPRNLFPVHFDPVSLSSVKTYGGFVLKVVGNVMLRVNYLDKAVTVEFAVVDVECLLVCKKLSRNLGIPSRMANEINTLKDGDALDDFNCLFEGIGKIKNRKCDLKFFPRSCT